MKNLEKDLHHWTKNDYKLIYFICKYGFGLIWLKSEMDVSTFIGTTETSVKKMCSNFRHLMGQLNQLTHIKVLQQEIFDEYKNKPLCEFRNEIYEIIDQEEKMRERSVFRMGREYKLQSSKVVN